ncbi:MAG: transposase, partial [Dehalococcoidia bacterium]|nr:transposase [Dehalococcoidia bacterium]
TKALVDRLLADRVLRQLCGWEKARDVPSLATFSRAFGEFANSVLADETHAALVKTYLKDEVVWHVSRDSTAIEAREKPAPAPVKGKSRYGRGRPKKGENRSDAPNRIETQYLQSADEAIAELPKFCDVGAKSDTKGGKRHWTGYKFHVDVGDGGVPLCAVTTSASLHDSQVALPLMKMTSERVTSLYDLMDSAYDAEMIRKVSCELGHVPIIDSRATRSQEKILFEPDRLRRYYNRTASERFYARLKDDCGGRTVRVKGHTKVHSHLMYGLLVIFAQSLLGLVT